MTEGLLSVSRVFLLSESSVANRRAPAKLCKVYTVVLLVVIKTTPSSSQLYEAGDGAVAPSPPSPTA